MILVMNAKYVNQINILKMHVRLQAILYDTDCTSIDNRNTSDNSDVTITCTGLSNSLLI